MVESNSIVHVALAERSYDIHICAEYGLEQAKRLLNVTRGQQLLIVSNSTPFALYGEKFMRHLQAAAEQLGRRVQLHSMVFPDGETNKTLASAEQIFHQLADLKATRDASLVALGGGVIGDLTGFAAALWMRGVDFVQVPTTLLAMVDSSVGGKTAVNLVAGKNLVGAFWQPVLVQADLSTLASLPEREYVAGLAEVVKYGAIADAEFFAWLEANAESLMRRDLAALNYAIKHSCQMKAGIVQRDERETGERMLLNFGHTFGHALEAAGQYQELKHGEAVAIGMVCAAKLSADLGLATMVDYERLSQLLQRFQLSVKRPAQHSPEQLVTLMKLDKKNLATSTRLILWRGIGQAFVSGASDQAMIAAWQ